MLDLLTVVLEEFIALFASIILYKFLPKAWRLLCLQVAVAFVVEITGYIIRKNHQPNGWLYNIYLPIDCSLHLLISYYLINEKRLKPIFLGVFLLFIFVWFYDILYLYGITKFATHAYIVDSVLLIAAFLYLLFYAALRWQKAIFLSPIFWLCLGVIIFYGCNITYFALLDSLASSLTKRQNDILLFVLKSLVAVRYLLITLSFYLVYYNKKKKHNN